MTGSGIDVGGGQASAYVLASILGALTTESTSVLTLENSSMSWEGTTGLIASVGCMTSVDH